MFNDRNWSEGIIEIPCGEDTIKCQYWVKHYEEPNEDYGINGGRISKLEIRIGDKKVAHYDRGWDLYPICKEAKMVLGILLNDYN